jgi:hypothetical protein
MGKLKAPDVKFTCTSCHWDASLPQGNELPYIVCGFSIYFILVLCVLKYTDFLQGFTIKGKPVLQNFLKVTGAFQVTSAARVQAPSTVLLHIRYHAIALVSHFTIVQQLFAEFYPSCSNDVKQNPRLLVLDKPFNIGVESAADNWDEEITQLVSNLSSYERVVIFVTTHSDPDTGDLWLGDDEQGDPCSAAISVVSPDFTLSFYTNTDHERNSGSISSLGP